MQADCSPFNRSGITRRSPPPTPTPAPCPRKRVLEDNIETVSTQEIQNWLGSIEQCLNEVCSISTDGKLNSEQKLKISNLCRKVGHGVSQMAVQYQSLKQKALLNHNSLHALKEKQDLAESLAEFKQNILETFKKKETTNTSFAEMVKKGTNSFVRPTPLSSLAIYPSDNSKTSDDTKNLVQKIICPEEMKLKVRGVRKIRNGGVMISTDSKDDLEKLKQSTQLTASGLTVDEPRKRKPRIIIIGVPSIMVENDVYKCIFEQNLADKHPSMSLNNFLSSIKLSHKSGKKNAETCNYILELPADLRKALITQDRLFINWTSCPVRDLLIYGHAAKTCKSEVSTCGHCGVDGHSIQECPKNTTPPKCATCLQFKKPSEHKTGDAEFLAKKAAEYRYINSVDYVVA